MKRVIALLSLLLLLGFSCTAQAAAPGVVVDGLPLSFDVAPVIEHDNTLVPLQTIFEALGAEIIGNDQGPKIIATQGTAVFEMEIGSANAYIIGNLVKLPVPVKTIDGCPMVPIRFISKALFAQVDWDAKTNTVIVRSKEVTYLRQEITKGLVTDMEKTKAIHDWTFKKDHREDKVLYYGYSTP